MVNSTEQGTRSSLLSTSSNHESSALLHAISDEDSSPYLISPEIMAKEMTREKWVCDICQDATFDDFQEACAHETLCQKVQEKQINDKLESKKEKVSTVEDDIIICIDDHSNSNDSLRNGIDATPMKPKTLQFIVADATNTSRRSCTFESCQVCVTREDDQDECVIFPIQSSKKPKKSTSDVQFVATKQTAPLFLKQAPIKKSVSTKVKVSKPIAVPTNPVNAQAKQTKIAVKQQQPIAILFQKPSEQSAVLAEHRAAEFAAKRRIEQEVERERQRKRQETRQALYEEKQKKQASASFVPSDFQVSKSLTITPKRLGTGSTESPIDLTNDTPQTKFAFSRPIGAIKKIKDKHFKAYPPRFPKPTHLIPCTHDTTPQHRFLSKELHSKFIRTSRYQTENNYVSGNDLSICSCELPLDTSPVESLDVLHESFSGILQPYVSDSNVNDESSNLLWCEKYAMKILPHDVYGDENKQTAESLMTFIQEWKYHRQRMYQARAEARERAKQKSKKKKKKVECYSDDDFFSDEEEGGLCNLFLLTGDTGSGKTCLVHAAAKSSQCPVIEINSSMERGSRALKLAIEESTQSESSLALLKHGNMLDSCGMLDEDDDVVDETPNSSLAIILIDEVDLLFETEGDNGFWQGLSAVCKNAKCPIILTSTSTPRQISNFRFKQGHLTRPTPLECSSKMCQIARMEGMKWHQDVDQDTIKTELAAIARVCGCDLRKIMNEMQMYRFGGQSKGMDSKFMTKIGDKESLSSSDDNYLRFPRIYSVSPKTVPSTSNTIVKISGANFTSVGTVKPSAIVPRVFFGENPSPLARVIDDNSIVAICPPSDRHTRKECDTDDEVNESICDIYKRISVELTYPNGAILRSDVSVSALEFGEYRNSTFIEYSFPYLGEDNSVDSSPTSLQELSNIMDRYTYKTESHANLVKASPSYSASGAELEVLIQSSESASMKSDFILISDGLEDINLKPLTGLMLGSDGVMNEEAGILCGWLNSSNNLGASDEYMVRPTSRRDILLIADACKHARGKANFNADAMIPSQPVEEENNPSIDIWTYYENDEDTFLCSQYYCASHYEKAVNVPITYLRQDHEKTFRTNSIVNQIDNFSPYIINNERSSSFMTDESYWLDYIPFLRHIATVEEKHQKRIESLLLADTDSKPSNRRSSRRSQKRDRTYHYFESIFDANSYQIDTDDIRGVTAVLSKLELQYDAISNETEYNKS